MKKYYINFEDKQGGTFGMYCCQTLKGWRDTAMEWADCDDNTGTYYALKNYKIKNSQLLDYINEFWDIDIREITNEQAQPILDYERNSDSSCPFWERDYQELYDKITEGEQL